jgi:nicotinate-nucleotide adenylyltransferase
MACYYILEIHEVDEMWIVPVLAHPFGKALTPYADRVEMCRLAAEPFGGRVRVSGIEQELSSGGPVYTVDLLSEMRKRRPDDKLSFVMGSDTVSDSHAWRDFGRIKELANLIILRRRGFEDAADSYMCMLPEISSTSVRDAIRKGGGADGLVPARVLRYIRHKGLYNCPGP